MRWALWWLCWAQWALGVWSKGGWGSRGGAGGGGFSLYGRKSSSSLGRISPSPRMSSFMLGAGVGYLAGRSHSYYYTPYGFHSAYGRGHYWAREKNVCSVRVPASEVRKKNTTAEFEEKGSEVTLYFLCDGSCCGKDCCELNGGFIAFIVIAVLVSLCCCAGCCYKLSKDESSSVGRWTSSLRRDPAAAQRGAGAARNGTNFSAVPAQDAPYPPAPQPASYDPYGTGGAAQSSAQPPSYSQATYNPYKAPDDIGFKA